MDYSKSEAVMSQRIRRMALKQELAASCKTSLCDFEGCIERRWWFGDHCNWLQSPPHGLDNDEALAFLLNWSND